MKKSIVLFLLLFTFLSCNSQKDYDLVELSGTTMGTTYSIKYTNTSSQNIEEVKSNISVILETVNAQMSTYLADSELSQFNSFTDTSWFSVSNDLAFVLQQSLGICRLTNGALDISVGPLVNLWGFGPGNKPTKIPSDSAILKALEFVGWENISVTLDPPAVKKKLPDIYCDLSSTAKGFGVDKVSDYLVSLGIKNYLVEIGGELRAEGKKSIDKEWRVGISKPDINSSLQEVITLNNNAMATSGDYWNYFEDNGIRYSHTIDPKTGNPIKHKLASITVFAKTCLLADGLATAIDVMGNDVGYKFALENKLPAYFIIRNKDEFVVNYNQYFQDYIVQN